MLVPANVK